MTQPVPQPTRRRRNDHGGADAGWLGGDRARSAEPARSCPAGPVTLVLSREVRAGHEDAFEEVLHRLAIEVARQPGHLDVTVLRPPLGGRRIYTIVSHFASRADADAWLANPNRAALV